MFGARGLTSKARLLLSAAAHPKPDVYKEAFTGWLTAQPRRSQHRAQAASRNVAPEVGPPGTEDLPGVGGVRSLLLLVSSFWVHQQARPLRNLRQHEWED